MVENAVFDVFRGHMNCTEKPAAVWGKEAKCLSKGSKPNFGLVLEELAEHSIVTLAHWQLLKRRPFNISVVRDTEIA